MLGYLIFEISQANLVIVVVSVLALAVYDFWSSNRRNGNSGER